MMNQEPRLHSSYLQSLGKKGNKSKQMQIKASNITKSVTPYNPVAQPADMLLQICFLPYSILSLHWYLSLLLFTPKQAQLQTSFVGTKIQNLKGIFQKESNYQAVW